MFEVTLFSVVAIMVAPFGANIVASHQVAINFASMLFMLPLSIGIAATIRVGHVLGENEPVRAISVCKAALIVALAIAAFNALLTLFFRHEIAYLYTSDEQVVAMAASLMFFAAIFQLSDGLQVVSGCVLRGYKDTRAMLYITFVAFWLIGLPVGIVLGTKDWIVQPMAAQGFWIGFISALTCAAIMLGIRLLYVQKKSILDPQWLANKTS